MAASYAEFLDSKRQLGGEFGFDPVWMPDFLFDFQQTLLAWATRKGRGGIFADCGLGKTPMQLVWAAELDTGSEIEEMDKVDGTIVVRTDSALWLFHPLEYRWLGPLNAQIEEVTAFNLAYPTVVKAGE